MSPSLSPWDYVVVAVMLLISGAIGAVFAVIHWKNNQSTQELFLGGRQMGVLPVTMSLLASFLSAIMILGTTTETYMYGLGYVMFPLGLSFVLPIAAYLYIPVFYNLQITSVYEYLELRFNSSILRKAISAMSIFQMLLYMAVVLYAPSLAVNAIMGFNVWLSVIVCGVVCTLYTSLGGLRAVMWTDVFQVLMMASGIIAVIAHGCVTLGGPAGIWNTSLERGRLNISDIIRFDAYKRYDLYSTGFGGGFMWATLFCVSQSQVQRALACPTLRNAQIAFLLNIPGVAILMTLGCLAGLVVFTNYKDCDPFLDGKILSTDQLLPLYVMEQLSQYPGVPGLFMAAVFSGSLSTISSGMNSLSTMAMDDLILPCLPNMSKRYQMIIAKLSTIVFGALLIFLAFVASKMGSISKIAVSLFGMIGGPILGVYTLGIFFPPANEKGAVAGLLVGLIQQFWFGFGAMAHGTMVEPLPRSTDGCNAPNSTSMVYNITQSNEYSVSTIPTFNSSECCTDQQSQSETAGIYKITFMWYACLAVFVTVTSGLVVSFLTGRTQHQDLNFKTISPVSKWICGYDFDNTLDQDDDLEASKPLRAKSLSN